MDQTFDEQSEKKDQFVADALCNVHSAVRVCLCWRPMVCFKWAWGVLRMSNSLKRTWEHTALMDPVQ